jgi:sugar/nucleoside kinase (ribokinase family)
MATAVAAIVPNVIVSRGARGLLVPTAFRANTREHVEFMQVAATSVLEAAIVDATGAGDSFVSGFIAAFTNIPVQRGAPTKAEWIRCIDVGLSAAALTLQSPLPVSPALNPKMLLS